MKYVRDINQPDVIGIRDGVVALLRSESECVELNLQFEEFVNYTLHEHLAYRVERPIVRKVLKIRTWVVPPSAWAVGSCSSGPPAGGTPQILIFKTWRTIGRPALYNGMASGSSMCVN